MSRVGVSMFRGLLVSAVELRCVRLKDLLDPRRRETLQLDYDFIYFSLHTVTLLLLLLPYENRLSVRRRTARA